MLLARNVPDFRYEYVEEPDAVAKDQGPYAVFKDGIKVPYPRLLAENAKASHVDRPIHIAARGDCVEFIQSIVARGVSINSAGAAGFTALHFAVQAQNRQLIADIVEMGADLNIQNMGGETPLHLAVHKGDVETVTYLLDQGVDASVCNAGDSTPGVVARGLANQEIHRIFFARGLPLLKTIVSTHWLGRSTISKAFKHVI
ncbi:hypothetical protein PG994_008582 [Apiospora phragmitis]|uniref:Ankyrin repeat domain-containing protein n=1 Tax=Apiospora phragmitis TaxID=2905665 RepID=A0ABR1UGV8_9PEZI